MPNSPLVAWHGWHIWNILLLMQIGDNHEALVMGHLLNSVSQL